MATIEPGTPKYESYFGSIQDKKFESRLPPYDVIQDALADPSLDPTKIDEAFAINDEIGSAGILRKQGVADLQLGSKFMLRALTVPVSGIEGAAGNGLPSHLIQAVSDVTAPVQLATSLSIDGVNDALGLLKPGQNPGQAAGRAAFGLGMTVLSAMGPIGAAAAAIVGFAAAIFSAFRSARIKEAKDEEARRRAAYERLPPLQEQKTNVDDWYVDSVLLSILETGNWTSIFSPRFDWNSEWVGVPRFGGYALAPGSSLSHKDEFGFDTRLFEPAGGIGFVPGFNRITSVVQVSVDWMSPDYQYWQMNYGGYYPIMQGLVQDVGSFYVNTARLASVAWSWVANQDAGLDLYKVHVGTHSGAGDHLMSRWRKYCESGIRFLTQNAQAWHSPDEYAARIRSGDPAYMMGSAIGCAVGAWRCRVEGGTSNHPVYSHLSSGGYETFEIGVKTGLGPGRRDEWGCVMNPASASATSEDGVTCLFSIYDLRIRFVLEELRKRQIHFLRSSLVCAYVRSSWDAFKDDALKQLLLRLRSKLLEHPDRKLVNLRDVPHDEPGVPHRDGTWREQLLAAGVPRIPTVSKIKLNQQHPAGTIEPTEEPAPTVPGTDAAMPFAGFTEPEEPSEPAQATNSASKTWRNLAVGGGAVLAAAGLTAAGLRRRSRG